MSVFEKLNAVNVNGHTEKKNGLTYLSWAWAWAEVKKAYPDAMYTVYENADGLIYHTDGRTAWVKTGVTIEGLEHIEYLPIMDFKNKSIPLENLTSTDVNKAIQRSLTKACARHGLGLYIYALPEESPAEQVKPATPEVDISVAKNLAQTAVETYALNAKLEKNTILQTVRRMIGKPFKDFTADDWRKTKELAEGWNNEAKHKH